ncbi:hypothetical protein [Methylobacterium gregans]|uniref:Phospholipase A2 domain-containing protein n=1 Tax=Methylobacterium gregans TaxID=374424 RepID=A0AA37HLM6_9HYPH|nr:hypothetical protein [Methylobacterium gregans]MDQ0521409.1 hypothetical protein [Methylobacterium gregans]GJD78079.1 hypothetical protein NBEOAGPD_1291 [Methylobacterium gregans]GLS54573.1 hypothetical protein GCM10007886_27560 [Methylobacterium gregans]
MTVSGFLQRALLTCAFAGALAPAGWAQEPPRINAGRGSFLIHGNFCGPGNRGPGYPPIDALDLACARHDACSPPLASGRLAACACHDRLHAEADLVARNPGTLPSLRDTARFVSDFALALPCDP